MHASSLAYLLLLNLGNDATHNELGLPTTVNLIKTIPTYMPTGKPNVENEMLSPGESRLCQGANLSQPSQIPNYIILKKKMCFKKTKRKKTSYVFHIEN